MTLPDLEPFADTPTLAGRPIFELGPFGHHLFPQDRAEVTMRSVLRRAALLGLVAWLPLPVLAWIADGLTVGPATHSLLSDVGIHVRLLLAVPALALADGWCGSRLSVIARHFGTTGLCDDATRPRLAAILESARRLCAARWSRLLIALLAYASVFAAFVSLPDSALPQWQRTPTLGAMPLVAWWHLLVSAPLVFVLVYSWIWRWGVWFRLLIQLSRLPFHLSATHPDQAAGVRFVGYSLRAFAPVAFAVGAIFAGRAGADALNHGVALTHYQDAAIGTILATVIVIALPTLAFTPRLLREWRLGVFAYGNLGSLHSRFFEQKWVLSRPRIGPEIVDAEEYSIATDLQAYIGSVYSMHLTTLDVRSLIVLAIATGLPMLGVMLAFAPIDVLIKEAAGLLF
ncbi:MAG: hypothetical protein JSR18_02170 [Proteobacteria bacterium]|nr:hypothetical protein [Pseudomonadota bacterium]